MSQLAPEQLISAAKKRVTDCRQIISPGLSDLDQKSKEIELQRDTLKRGTLDEIFNELKAVAGQLNVDIESHQAKLNALIQKIEKSLPEGAAFVMNPRPSVRDDGKNHPKEFVLQSTIAPIVPYLSPDVDRALDLAVKETDRMLQQYNDMYFEFFTPAVSRGTTTGEENSTYPGGSSNWITQDSRKAVFEDAGLQFLKRQLSLESGNFSIINFNNILSSKREHRVVNPYACYWSGEIDFDLVKREHFFRWRIKIPIKSKTGMQLVGSFEPDSLFPEYEI